MLIDVEPPTVLQCDGPKTDKYGVISTPGTHADVKWKVSDVSVRGVSNHFDNPTRLELPGVTKKLNLTIKRLKTKKTIENVEGSNPRQAQILTINPRYMGCSIRPFYQL